MKPAHDSYFADADEAARRSSDRRYQDALNRCTDRLRALHVGVARQQGLEVLARAHDQDAAQLVQGALGSA